MEQILYWAKRLYNAGLSPATTGNISKREDENILITASGSAAADLSHEDIVKINFEGDVLEGAKKPSSEKFMHIKIYKKRPDINAIIHSHSPYITAFAAAGKEINKAVIPELPVYFGKVPICDYSMPSSNKLADDVSELFNSYSAVLMKNHGAVLGAKDLKTAFYLLETLDMYSKIYFNSILLGGPKTINKKHLEELKGLRK